MDNKQMQKILLEHIARYKSNKPVMWLVFDGDDEKDLSYGVHGGAEDTERRKGAITALHNIYKLTQTTND